MNEVEEGVCNCFGETGRKGVTKDNDAEIFGRDKVDDSARTYREGSCMA